MSDKINMKKYLSEFGITSELAHLAGIEVNKMRNYSFRVKNGLGIKTATKSLILKSMNKREGGGIVMSDLIWK